MKNTFLTLLTAFGIMAGVTPALAQLPAGYKGLPYKDSVYTGNKLNAVGAQNLPGSVELAYYDLGGEGVGYHDNTPDNFGAVLNRHPGEKHTGISDYIACFRPNEGVDIDYAKDNLDFTPSNKVHPKAGQWHIGWQEDGEWTNYTVFVHHKGKYNIYTVYSSVDNRPAELWINNQYACRLNFRENTGSLHTWTQSEVGEILFPETGVYLLTVKFGGGVQFGSLDFLFNDARQN
jgi:hypothetical protein